MSFNETEHWARRRRPFERMEKKVVQLQLQSKDQDSAPVADTVRYALNFAKLLSIENSNGTHVDVSGPLARHASDMRLLLDAPIEEAKSIWDLSRGLPDVVERTRQARESLLQHLPVERDALEAEVTTRLLAVASGGGGGAGYVYPGAYEVLERIGLVPDLMTGTSIGALMGLFRARRRRYDFAPLVNAAKRLAWSNMFQVLETENRYGLPATLRLYLRQAIGSLFVREDGGTMWLSDMEIPLYLVATGIKVEALKHDLDYYEHLLDDSVGRRSVRGGMRAGMKALSVLREFLATPDALSRVVLGRDEGTEHFDALDAAGFSAAIPAVLHYDVLRDAARMHRILDTLYAQRGITRLGEDGMVSNVPARVAWESIVDGRFGRRNCFVLALDCFAPSRRRMAWYPIQQAVRTANVEADRKSADLYVTFQRTLSPMNLVPDARGALTAVRWGRDQVQPHAPLILEMMRELPVLK
ncbi:MAG: hypothetical protein GWP91_17850 [Rhodobacterales bacterium]|nr:hypothetical protein [Rhodobacterales bacterium]